MRTYQARSMSDALVRVKRELGRDAVILHTRTIRRGGVLGIGAKMWVEITATSDERVNTMRKSAGMTGATIRRTEIAPPATELNREAVQIAPDKAATNIPAQREAMDPAVLREIQEIRAMVRELAARGGNNGETKQPVELIDDYTRLLQQHVAEELARQFVEGAVGRLKNSDSQLEQVDNSPWTREQIEAELLECISTSLPPAAPLELNAAGRTTIVALVGPTGVGKTTTLAKLAANMKLREGKSVGLITIDTYRIAAVEQLKTYAEILKLPVVAVSTPQEVAGAIEMMQGLDLILIDTAGRSQRDEPRIEELGRFLEAAKPDQIHLVLSSTSREETNREAMERFSTVGANHVIFTKLDEAVGFGAILNALHGMNLQLSYLTDGQSVPDDIEPASGRRLARLLLGLDQAGARR